MEGRKMLWFAVCCRERNARRRARAGSKGRETCANKPTSPASGEEMYNTYCAVCHSKDGKGNGTRSGSIEGSATGPDSAHQEQQGKLSQPEGVGGDPR